MRSRSKNLLLYRFVVCVFRGVGMNIIEKFIKVLEGYMDNLSIKKKFIQLYIFCVLLPLIIRTVSSYILKTAWNRSGSIMRWQTLRMQSAIISVHWWRMREKLLKVCIQIEG